MADSAAAQRRRQRRIPSESRKRNALSCDRCRKRRCKCVPSWTGSGCVTCQELSIPCSYTTPRKTRFYGSVDDLSDRIRCLEAVVKGAFPHDTITTAEDVLRLGQRMGYPMPDLSDESRSFLKIEDMVRLADPPQELTTQAGHMDKNVEPAMSRSDQASQPPRTRSDSEDPQVSLVRDTAGHEHYIGPSGTLSFLGQLRKLVDRKATAIETVDSEGVHQFVQDDAVQALEADDEYDKGSEAVTTNPGDSTGPDRPSPGSITSAIARDFTRLPSADMEEILKQFPPNETLEHLVNAYFKNVHDDFPLFHRATFEEEFELFITRARRWPQIGTTRNRPLPDWGWIGCLHMIVVFGSISQPKIPDVDHAALRRRSVTATRVLLPQFVAKCTLTNVRVLLLLSLFLHNNNERNAAWNLVGTATRICFALGLHRSDMGASFRPIEREVRKRVFCTLYSFEQFLASSLGRPSGVQEVEVETVPPREGFLDGGGGGTDAKLMSLSLSLQSTLSQTRLIYLGKRKRDTTALGVSIPTVAQVLSTLTKWKKDIGQLPGFDLPWIKVAGLTDGGGSAISFNDLKESLAWKTRTQLRAVLMLHIQYHYIVLTATRPLLLRDIAMVRNSKAGAPVGQAPLCPEAEDCVRHACQLGHIVLLLDSFEMINGLWGLDIFYAYCAAMVLILRLLHRDATDVVATGTPESQQQDLQEQNVETAARTLVGNIQDVINRADKSGSMRRFAQVVETFSRCIDKPGSRLIEMPSTHNFHHGATNGLHQYLPMDYMASNPMPMNAQPFHQYGQENNGSMVPLSTFGSTGGFDSQAFGMDEFAMPEWSDMEMFFGNYGVQG